MRNPFARHTPCATERLEALQAAALAGEDVTAAQIAQARAEIDAEKELEELTARGKREREKAAKELAKRQATAKAALRENPPAHPADELAAAYKAAQDAIQAVNAVRAAYVARLNTAKQTFTDAGVVEPGTGVAEQEGTDWDNHGVANVPAIVIDGTTYSTDRCTAALEGLARYALDVAGTGKIPKHV